MKTNVIQVDFAGKSPAAEWSGQVVDLGRQAARALVKHAGVPAELSREEGTYATAKVKDAYRLQITVGAYSTLRRRPRDVDIHEWRAMREKAPCELVFEVACDVEWLRDQALATEGNFGNEHACVEFSSLEAAVAWVRENCTKAPVLRVASEDLAAWAKVMVRAGKADGASKGKVSLIDAIKIYGPIYKGAISADVLVQKHGVPREDAEKIASAVRRISPRKRKNEGIPACAASMGCLCYFHARGGEVDAPCDASEPGDK